MKNFRYVLATTCILAITATSGFALAQADDANLIQPRMARRVIARVEARLNITAEQHQQMKAILKAEEPTIVALAVQSKAEREAMVSLPAYNEAEVRDIAQRYAATNTDIVVERAKVRLELRAVLTAQQLAQVEAFKSKLNGHFDERLDQFIDQL